MSFIDLLISISLGVIMFGIGITLQFKDFMAILRRPKAIILGLSLQMLFLPLLFISVLYFLPLDPLYKVGLILVSLCPGGSTSNFISYLVRANVALSVTLTTINSFIILVSLPLIFGWSLGYFLSDVAEIHLPVWQTIQNVLILIVMPTFAGMAFRRRYESLALKVEERLRIINIILFAGVYGIKFFAPSSSGGSGLSASDFTTLLPIALGLHLMSIMTAYFMARKSNLDRSSQVTISIEVGLQNTTLALLIASTILQNEFMAKPALVYAAFSFFTTAAFAWTTSRLGSAYRVSIEENQDKEDT